MDIPKLVKNIKKRGIMVNYPEFTIFVLWMSRICKAESWKVIYRFIAWSVNAFLKHLKET